MALAMSWPISVSPLAEMVATCLISSVVVTVLDMLRSVLTTTSCVFAVMETGGKSAA